MDTENKQSEPSQEQGHHILTDAPQTKSKISKRHLVIITFVLFIALLGYIVPVVMKTQDGREKNDIQDRVIWHIDYTSEASRVFFLPITWKVIFNTDETTGIAVRIDSVKDAFPSGQNIMVNFDGKAFFLNNEQTHEYDYSLRVKLDVVPTNGELLIQNMQIDSMAVFNATNNEIEALKNVERQLVEELRKQCNKSYTNIPEKVDRIKEMTLDGITFYLK